jgi:hypothetical protein
MRPRETPEMQSAHGAHRVGERLVVLHEADRKARRGGEPLRVEGLDEIPPVVCEALGAKQQDLGNLQTLDFHGPSTLALDAPAGCPQGVGGQNGASGRRPPTEFASRRGVAVACPAVIV